MSETETENSGDKTLTVTPSKTLHLKQRPTEHGGMVRQSFSHGRSKVVVVEKVKRRAPGHVETKPAAPATAAPAAPAAPVTRRRLRRRQLLSPPRRRRLRREPRPRARSLRPSAAPAWCCAR